MALFKEIPKAELKIYLTFISTFKLEAHLLLWKFLLLTPLHLSQLY